jgi:hypothetical protein
MSETWLRLVPRNEEYIPSPEAQVSAAKYFFQEFHDFDDLESLETEDFDLNNDDDEFSITEYEVLTFFVDYDFIMDWEEEDEDETIGYKFEPRKIPCCNKEFTLRDLSYDFDQGFGYFCLKTLLSTTLSADKIANFERILDCPLRVIYQRL